jgi:uncharacterized membrane protein YfcA
MSFVTLKVERASEVRATSRIRANLLARAGNVRWRDGLAIALTAGAAAALSVVVVVALRETDLRTVVILAAMAGLLAIAGQTVSRREMLTRLAESRK